MSKWPVLLMETGVGAVPGGAAPGWVSGDPSLMAAGALVDCVFDLGPDWRQYGLVSVTVFSTGPAAQYASVSAVGSDTTAYNGARRMNHAFASSPGLLFITNVTTAGGGADFSVRPRGRFLLVRVANEATNQQGSGSKVTLTAYPA